MAALKFSFILLLSVVSCATASGLEPVNFNNQLSACVEINGMKITTEGRIPVLSFDLKMNKPISECGCKSALGAYTVFSKMEEYQSYIIGGKVAFKTSEHKYLPLSAEQSLIDKKLLEVNLSCAQPD